MAIRNPENWAEAKLTVTLTDGTRIGPCDTTDRPLGDDGCWVTVWVDDRLVSYPREQVASVEFSFDADANQP